MSGRRLPVLEISLAAAAVLCLAGLALPAAARLGDEAECAQCQENLRRIGEAIAEWSRLHDSALPPGRGMSGFCNSDTGEPLPGNLYAVEPGLNALWDKGRGVIRDPSVFVCPGDRNIEPPPAVGEDFTSPGQLSYAMTGNIYPTDPPNKVVVADKSDKTRPDRTAAASANHGGRFVNALFFDGRVQRFSGPVLPAGSASDGGSIYARETGDRHDTYIE